MRALIVFGVLAFAAWAQAWEVISFDEQIPESNVVTRTRVTDKKTQVSFIAHATWVASSDPAARRISFQSAAPQATINIVMTTNAMPANPEKFKERLTPNLKEPEVLNQYNAACGSGAGLAVEVRHNLGVGYRVQTRVTVFPSEEGSVEVQLAAPAEEFEKFENYWIGFINSFRVEKRPAPKPAAK